MDCYLPSWLQDRGLTVGLTFVDTGCISTLLVIRFLFVGFECCTLWMAIYPPGYKIVVCWFKCCSYCMHVHPRGYKILVCWF